VKPIPLNAATRKLARRLIWFETPSRALADPVRFMAYAFSLATPGDMAVLADHVDEDGMREALDTAPPGIIDPRSWAYWNARLGRYPPPPLPTRRLGDPA
jgi:hypothetical protein